MRLEETKRLLSVPRKNFSFYPESFTGYSLYREGGYLFRVPDTLLYPEPFGIPVSFIGDFFYFKKYFFTLKSIF